MDRDNASADLGQLPSINSPEASALTPQQREFAQVIGREIARAVRESRQHRHDAGQPPEVTSPTGDCYRDRRDTP
jgi:hypothetical protein